MNWDQLDKKLQARILKANRLLWSQSFRSKALTKATYYGFKPKKDGITPSKRKIILGYFCNHCGKCFDRKDVQVDHIIPIRFGKTLTERLNLLWCKIEGLQVLCKPCHQIKTNEERKK